MIPFLIIAFTVLCAALWLWSLVRIVANGRRKRVHKPLDWILLLVCPVVWLVGVTELIAVAPVPTP
ncbi:hypothetical protein [Deinococcus ruber]|uniref:Uncharacterized protein n=1 Tax=Deinococcus ruber TaxID=1848197 RepID=A0A918FGW7_9DEIO|nr:hypothetical protein [Deinococcus ruber]GGR36835.1 hypothetical protein GCM10008957_53000 [Deinococcus ruber]